MRIFVVGLAGSGNLGDDLISSILVDKIHTQYPTAEIGVLSGRYANAFNYPNEVIFFEYPNKKNLKTYIKKRRLIKNYLKTADLLVIGGGGLIQDVHSDFTIYKWLKYRYYSFKKINTILTGIGVGPVKSRIGKINTSVYLKGASCIDVRDGYSQEYLNKYNIPSEASCDIVEGSELPFTRMEKDTDEITLGCSIRPWKDLDISTISKLIIKTAEKIKTKKVKLFIFEYTPNNNIEYDFNKRLQILLGNTLDVEMFTYNKDNIEEFIKAFRSVDYAVAVRYHANIIWQKLGIPTMPLSYDAKINNFYGLDNIYSVNEEEFRSIDFLSIDPGKTYNFPSIKKREVDKGYLTGWVLKTIQGPIVFIFELINSIRIRIEK